MFNNTASDLYKQEEIQFLSCMTVSFYIFRFSQQPKKKQRGSHTPMTAALLLSLPEKGDTGFRAAERLP